MVSIASSHKKLVSSESLLFPEMEELPTAESDESARSTVLSGSTPSHSTVLISHPPLSPHPSTTLPPSMSESPILSVVPLFPNLAQAALEHLKLKRAFHDDENKDDDFKPLKRNRVEETGTDQEVSVCVCDIGECVV